MKIVTMLNDVAASLFKPPATQKYPFERQETPERLRSQMVWNSESCTGCGLCAKDCPANAVEMIVLDKKSKQFVMRYHVDRCVFCAQCVESCRQNCLTMSDELWELAALDRKPFLIYCGDKHNVRRILADTGDPGT